MLRKKVKSALMRLVAGKEIQQYADRLDEEILHYQSRIPQDLSHLSFNNPNTKLIVQAAESILPWNSYRLARFELYERFPWTGKGRSVVGDEGPKKY